MLADANILFSRTLRDWLGMLYLHSEGGMFQVHWTEDIMAETIYHLRKKHPHWSDNQVGGIRRRLVGTFGADNAITGYTIDPDITYPDLFDAHVHCAAVHGGVDIVLAEDTKGFSFDDDIELDYEIYSADEFFLLIDDSAPELVRRVTEEQLKYWLSMDGKPLPEALRAANAPDFAERVRQHLQLVDVPQVLRES